MVEILGLNLIKFFDSIDDTYENAEITYADGRYEVWEVSDELYKEICNMSEEEFVQLAGDDAWWISSNGSNLGVPDTKFEVNGEELIGWNRWEREQKSYSDLSEYLCECIGCSQPRNVCACTMDLAKYNGMTMSELFDKYER